MTEIEGGEIKTWGCLPGIESLRKNTLYILHYGNCRTLFFLELDAYY